MPGLTDELVVDLNRRVDVAGAPFAFVASWQSRFTKNYEPAVVDMGDLEEQAVHRVGDGRPPGPRRPHGEDVRLWLARSDGAPRPVGTS